MLCISVVSESRFVQSALQTHIKPYSLTQCLKGKQRDENIIVSTPHWGTRGISREIKWTTQEHEEGLKIWAESPVQCLSHNVSSLVAMLSNQTWESFPSLKTPVKLSLWVEKSSYFWFSNRASAV